MKVKIQNTEINIKGEVFAPPSKSYTHRAIAVASLSENAVIKYPLLSADTQATISACTAIGASIDIKKSELIINGVCGNPKIPDNVIDVANSGTTLRFMTAISALIDGYTVLTGDSSIRKRPNNPLLKALTELGAFAISTKNNGTAPIVIRGTLKGGFCEISGSISSQFISGLLLACPFSEKDTEIKIKGELKSRPYIDITLEVLKEADAIINFDSNIPQFTIPCNQEFNLKNYTIPGDFSSASYLLAASAIAGESEVKIKNLYPSKQGDSAIIPILEKMGANIEWNKKKGIACVKKSELSGITIDVSKTPDLVPTLAVLGAIANGTTIIENAEHVRYKETDRLHAMTVELSKMGVDIYEEKDKLIIKGGNALTGNKLHGWDDHRIVMALTIAAMVAKGNTIIDTAESVEVSYPSFFEDIKRLGGEVELIMQ
ncbi:MAG: 3-phosphoshikimate 1-carboxyvinyltransferase [Methanosarcinales archaeon]